MVNGKDNCKDDNDLRDVCFVVRCLLSSLFLCGGDDRFGRAQRKFENSKFDDDTRSSESKFIFDVEFVVHFILKIIRASFRIFKKSPLNYFEIGLSGVRLYIVGSLVDFVFVCWCSRVPTHYALSATVNRR